MIDIRIAANEIRVLIFNNIRNFSAGKTFTQGAQKRKSQDNIADRTKTDHQYFLGFFKRIERQGFKEIEDVGSDS